MNRSDRLWLEKLAELRNYISTHGCRPDCQGTESAKFLYFWMDEQCARRDLVMWQIVALEKVVDACTMDYEVNENDSEHVRCVKSSDDLVHDRAWFDSFDKVMTWIQAMGRMPDCRGDSLSASLYVWLKNEGSRQDLNLCQQFALADMKNVYMKKKERCEDCIANRSKRQGECLDVLTDCKRNKVVHKTERTHAEFNAPLILMFHKANPYNGMPRGISDEGDTCFMNTSFHMLLRVGPVVEYLEAVHEYCLTHKVCVVQSKYQLDLLLQLKNLGDYLLGSSRCLDEHDDEGRIWSCGDIIRAMAREAVQLGDKVAFERSFAKGQHCVNDFLEAFMNFLKMPLNVSGFPVLSTCYDSTSFVYAECMQCEAKIKTAEHVGINSVTLGVPDSRGPRSDNICKALKRIQQDRTIKHMKCYSDICVGSTCLMNETCDPLGIVPPVCVFALQRIRCEQSKYTKATDFVGFSRNLNWMNKSAHELRCIIVHVGDGALVGHYISIVWVGQSANGTDMYQLFDGLFKLAGLTWHDIKTDNLPAKYGSVFRNWTTLMFVKS